ncbi:hypothetical protein B0A50_07027 [Salinomyces thailandicus]|uniref:tRNA-dihydrouridine(16/17) synthase [NAD(P)(+)] n=1 Tax=Salinomyces thailandicus TaxID=706561 RepID=A0A4U0TPH4_9PEZI|nr:hypothetical protein B0A50_07027 [Salinomyces thailandica]
MATPTPKLHGRAFYKSLGSPKHVLAPMVDQSEFAWRLLTRSFMPPDLRQSVLCYSPMFHAKLFADSHRYRTQHFTPLQPPDLLSQTPPQAPFPQVEDEQAYLDGHPTVDRPLFVQFCANDPAAYLAAAKHVQPYCDAVDLNLGCPQGIARRGGYGAFLQEDWDTIYKLIHTLHNDLDIPVTAKIRMQETRERTLEYAKMILSAGASILTVHARSREMKGHNTGLADWSLIRYLRDQLPPETVIFANGNILQHADLAECLEATGADAVMSAEGNLYDPSIFAPAPAVGQEGREYWRGPDGKGGYRVDAVLRRYLDITHRHILQQEPPERAPLFVPEDVPAEEGGRQEVVPIVAPSDLPSHETTEHLRRPDPQTGDKRPASSPPPPETSNSSEWSRDSKATKRQKKREAKHAAKAQMATAGASQQQQHQTPPNNKPKPNKNGKNNKDKKNVENPLKYEPNLVAMQSHCFHLLKPLVARFHDVRDALARTKAGDVAAFERVLSLVEEKVRQGLEAGPSRDAHAEADEGAMEEAVAEGKIDEQSSDAAVKRCRRPWWVCQAYVRPLPKEALVKGSLQLSKKELRRLEAEDAAAAAAAGKKAAGSVAEADAGDRVAAEAGVAPGGKVEEVERGVKEEIVGSASLPEPEGEAAEKEREGLLKVPKEGMVCG